jgi:hypothetical protein
MRSWTPHIRGVRSRLQLAAATASVTSRGEEASAFTLVVIARALGDWMVDPRIEARLERFGDPSGATWRRLAAHIEPLLAASPEGHASIDSTTDDFRSDGMGLSPEAEDAAVRAAVPPPR